MLESLSAYLGTGAQESRLGFWCPQATQNIHLLNPQWVLWTLVPIHTTTYSTNPNYLRDLGPLKFISIGLSLNRGIARRCLLLAWLCLCSGFVVLQWLKAMIRDTCWSNKLGFMELVHSCGFVVTFPCVELYFYFTWHEYQNLCKHHVEFLYTPEWAPL